MNDSDFRQSVANYMGDFLGKAATSVLSKQDLFAENEYHLGLSFKSTNYGRSMRGNLLIFQPTVVGRFTFIPPEDENRVNPIKQSPYQTIERIQIELPKGFTVDEKPEDFSVSSDFASFNRRCFVEDGVLHYHSDFTVFSTSIPADDYEAMRDFYRQCVNAEKVPVVLVRQES